MSKSDYQELIAEYKDQIRILKQEVAELQDAGKSKDSANKRSLQKLEHITDDLEKAQAEIKRLTQILLFVLIKILLSKYIYYTQHSPRTYL